MKKGTVEKPFDTTLCCDTRLTLLAVKNGPHLKIKVRLPTVVQLETHFVGTVAAQGY
jgi:hypothetical protein